MNILKRVQGLGEKVARLEKDWGIVHKADTGTNDPAVPSIDGQRDIIAELVARSVSRGNALVQSALLRSQKYRDYLATVTTNNLYLQQALVESVLEAARILPGPEGIDEPSEPYDHEGLRLAQERARLQQMGHEILARPVGDIHALSMAKQNVPLVLAVCDAYARHFEKGGTEASAPDAAKLLSAAKREQPAIDPHPIQKSATDTTPADVRSMGRPRRMHLGEILR